MKIKTTSFLQLTVPLFIVLLLSGCFGDGGGTNYDGIWTVGYVDSSFVPPAAASSSVAVVCTVSTPLPTVTIVNGAGSTSQTNTCIGTVSDPQNFIYLISIAINASTGVVSAIVNGSSLTGQCISAKGCGAQSGTKSLSLTR